MMASSLRDQPTAISTGKDAGGNPSSIPDQFKQKLKEVYEKDGIPGTIETVKKSLNEWKEVPVNFAIIGNCGVGKSSYINALCGITADDEGAAPVGVVETTSVPTPYPHPKNKNMIFWDLQGVGTPNCPKKGYLQKIKFEIYDFFLLFAAVRFTDKDMWLAQQIRQAGKRFYFIRTKIDSDIFNDKNAHPRTHSRVQVIHEIRSDCINQLQNEGFANPVVFLISNFDVNEFDFGHLTERFIRDASDIKQEALALSLSILTEEVIRAKERYLKKRIYMVSIASAIGAAVPLPGFGTCVDIAIILQETLFYREQLRLDETSVEQSAAALNISVSELQSTLTLESQILVYSAEGLLFFLSSLGISNVTEDVLSIVVPVIGSILAGGLSYGVTVVSLRRLLKMLVNDALRINEKMNTIFDRNAKDVSQTT